MKHLIFYCLAFFLFLLNGCGLQPDVNISGSTYDIPSGVVELIDPEGGEVISAGRINNNFFEIKQPYLKRAGYYSLVLAEDKRFKKDNLVYLETGKYKVNFTKGKPYPAITSTSKTQNEISAFYAMKDSMDTSRKHRMAGLTKTVKGDLNALSREELNQALNDLSSETLKEFSSGADALEAFMKRYPENHIAAQIMSTMAYDINPKTYYALYKKFNTYNKETAQGKKIGETLTRLCKLEPGEYAPKIVGSTPAGKKIDLKAFKTKLILVEFWKAASGESRRNHQTLVLNPNYLGNEVSIVSVNLDTKRDWWVGASKDDKINWTNVSDLQGNNSPNVKSWAVTVVPTYYLLDGQGKIIDREIPFVNLSSVVSNYLLAHTN